MDRLFAVFTITIGFFVWVLTFKSLENIFNRKFIYKKKLYFTLAIFFSLLLEGYIRIELNGHLWQSVIFPQLVFVIIATLEFFSYLR